jgi:hypothetical protein
MLQVRTGHTGDAERSDQEMNALAVVYVNSHLQELADEAAQRRTIRAHGPSLRQRIAATVSNVRSALATPTDNRGTMFPTLDAPDRS